MANLRVPLTMVMVPGPLIWHAELVLAWIFQRFRARDIGAAGETLLCLGLGGSGGSGG